MAQDIRVNVDLDDSKFRQGLAEDGQAVVEVGHEVGTAQSEIAQAQQRMQQISGGDSVRKQMRQTITELQKLELAYKKLDKADKDSTFGETMKQRIDELKEKQAELIDFTGDLQSELNAMASDTTFLDGFTEGVTVARDVLSTFVSVAGLSDKEAESLAKTMNTLAAVYSGSNAVIGAFNALQKNSKLMTAAVAAQLKIQAAGETLLTAAKARGTLATKAATVAQALFNKVAMMNPYVLIAMACVAAGAAIYGLVSAFSDSAEEEKRAQEAADQHKAYADALTSSLTEQITTFKELQAEYENCRTEGEKQEFLEQYKDKMHDLGVECDSTADLENIFVKNSEAMMQSFMLRAKAAAIAAKAQQIYNQALNGAMEGADINKQYSEGDLEDIYGEDKVRKYKDNP